MRRRLSYANVVATLALVFAMSGGALAASHYLITSTKQISPKVIKKLKGKTGPPGSPGRTGAGGAQGPAGTAGAKGEMGPKGETGPKGEAGLSALSTLPAGDSESGEVGVIESNPTASRYIEDTVTFPVPMPETLAESHVIFTTIAGTTHCSGEGHAEAGYLCIYVTNEGDLSAPLVRHFETAAAEGAGKDGFGAFWKVTTSGAEAYAEGVWTVTAG